MEPTTREFSALLARMTTAVCAGDGDAAAACFVPDGAYHDGFYGEFSGRTEIARMVREVFHRDARDFEWTLADAVSDGRIGYARYAFSYVPTLPGAAGRRVGFQGICCCRLKNGLIAHYSEIFERAQVLARLGFADARILKSVRKWAAG